MIALTALTMATGVAGAATNARNERPDDSSTATANVQTVQVRADSVMTAVELTRASLEADDMVTITAFPTNTQIAKNNQDR
ncbi:hypothetical protein [Paracoccus sp. JM45]|uniref:hypothetical protein n=1 Tax=Paracoccus sp. JM45 TaxID=2283626 RepID=UPI000E6C05C1|nr:hypothetical protein [Paracoccus sp. JM45]RJE79707.1 hypothetical protein DWB67_11370 [Paracoccus sp. JM45]